MQESEFGNGVIEIWLRQVREAVERDGELAEATVQNIVQNADDTNWLVKRLEKLRQRQTQNPDSLDAAALRERNKKEALAYVGRELGFVQWRKRECEQREAAEESARQAAAVLPSMETLDKILRCETKLERPLYRAMNQLERWQRMRQGESIPAPLTLELAGRGSE